MASYTANYRLTKPSLVDDLVPDPFNENFDVIDRELANLSINSSLKDSNTYFEENGSIKTTYANGSYVIVEFKENGDILESYYNNEDIVTKTKKTIFNSDGSISEIVEDN